MTNQSSSLRLGKMHWPILLMLAVMLALLFGGWFFLHDGQSSAKTRLIPEMAAAKKPVIGNFGGFPFSFPPGVLVMASYDDDPPFLSPMYGKSKPKERTFDSVMTGFALEFRYPDMVPQTTPRTEEERNIRKTNWMRAITYAGSEYIDDDTLERLVAGINQPYTHTSRFRYELLPEKVYGLTGYQVVDGPRGAFDDRNLYYARDDNGRVIAYIECSNAPHAAAPCSHKFNMLPPMKARVKASYRIGFLPQWQQIQQSLSQFLLTYQVEATTEVTEKNTPQAAGAEAIPPVEQADQ